MTNAKKFMQLQNELTAMPEFALVSRIQNFSLSINIFQGNYKDLRDKMVLYCQSPEGLSLLEIKNRYRLSLFQTEILRLLHNFIASAISLIDHARIFYTELYKEKNLFPDYQTEVNKRFIDNPLPSFVVSLRQYILHFKAPDINAEARWEPNSFSMPLTLSKTNLEEFSGWKSKAKDFLNNQTDSIDLLPLIDNYYNLVMDFYKWFFGRQHEIHSEQFKKVQQKQRELQEVRIPMLLETILADKNKNTSDELLTSIVTTQRKKYILENNN